MGAARRLPAGAEVTPLHALPAHERHRHRAVGGDEAGLTSPGGRSRVRAPSLTLSAWHPSVGETGDHLARGVWAGPELAKDGGPAAAQDDAQHDRHEDRIVELTGDRDE